MISRLRFVSALISLGGGSIAAAGPITMALHEPVGATLRSDVYPGAGYGFYAPLTGTTINRLGYWDQGGDGLLTSHQVIVVKYNGNSSYIPVASATIPAGTEAPLEGGYRWVTIPAVTLPNIGQGGDYYAVLASHGQDPWTETLGSAAPMNDGIGTVVSSALVPATGTLDAGAVTVLGNRPGGWGGANMGYANLPAIADPRIRVMPIGDSITVGFTDNPGWIQPFEFGYRGPLAGLLATAGFPFHFVGKSQEPFNNTSGDPTHGGTVYPVNELRDPGIDQGLHRGYGGVDIPYITAHVADWLATDDPNVILLMIGTNGISTSSPAQLNTLVTTIFAAKPGVKLVVAQIIPAINYNPDVVNYNSYIRNVLVPAFQAQGRNISTVDQYKNFLTNPANLTSIDTAKFANQINHPTNAAYQLMAASWFPALATITLDASSVPANTVADAVLANLGRSLGGTGEAFSYSLVAGAGDADNASFTISGSQLKAGRHPFQLDPAGRTYSLRVRATGATSGTVVQNLVLTKAAGAPEAVISIQTFSDPSETAFAADVKTDDLLQGLTGVHRNFNYLTGQPGVQINDGLFGGATDTASISWPNDGNTASSTYELGAGGGAGYDVSRITSFAAWTNAGFMNQKYKVSVRYAGASLFTPVPDCSVDFQPFASDGVAGSTKVVITRPGGAVFRGIDGIRFTFLDTTSRNEGGMTIREIDVEGTATLPAETRVVYFGAPQVEGGQAVITWQSAVGATYKVESSTDLATWSVLAATYESQGLTSTYGDASVSPQPAKVFYRISKND